MRIRFARMIEQSHSLTSPELDDAAYGRRFASDATESPDAAWARLNPHQVFAEPRFVVEPILEEDAGDPLLDPSAPDRYPPKRPGCVRLVCVSDTHGLHGKDHAATLALPAGDVLVHAGDFTNTGSAHDLASFAQWLAEQTQFAAKVVIAGNHDTSLDPPYYKREGTRFHRNADEGGGADGRARAGLRARVRPRAACTSRTRRSRPRACASTARRGNPSSATRPSTSRAARRRERWRRFRPRAAFWHARPAIGAAIASSAPSAPAAATCASAASSARRGAGTRAAARPRLRPRA